MVQKIYHYKNRFLEFYQRHEMLVSFFFFACGFTFDLLTLGRIDDLFNLIQQAFYLIVLGSLLLVEIKLKFGTLTLSEKGKKFWQYHDLIIHFLFGSLLSVYTLFFYSSASHVTSFFYIVLLSLLMLANEIKKIRTIGVPIRVILYSICVLSYFSYFYPILLGYIGPLPFWLGIVSSALVFGLLWPFISKNDPPKEKLKKHVVIPLIAVHIFFVFAYYTSLIPPVPLAIKKMGVYYEVEKRKGKYIGKHLRPVWNLWEKGSQNFSARPGDKVIIMLAIFSPARFQDQIYLKWYRLNVKDKWSLEDTIPLRILGGRRDGFRGYGSKQFYTLGEWRVIVETSDGREVGKIDLFIKSDKDQHLRDFREDIF